MVFHTTSVIIILLFKHHWEAFLITTKELELLRPITSSILKKIEELAEHLPPQENRKNDFVNELLPWRKKLIEVYARSIILEEEESVEALEEWGRQVSGKLVSLRLPLDIALEEISHYREVIGDHIKEEAKEQQLTFDEFYQIVAKFNRIVDKAVLMTSRSFMDDFEDTIKKAQYAVNELSIPVVRITEEAGIIPIVGEIDTNRAQILMENALSEGNKFDLDTIIIDLSGVSVIDTMVAHQIFKVIDSLKLTGIEAIVSGIRPDIVQTMVSLGIDMKHVETYSSLHRAIKKVVSLTSN